MGIPGSANLLLLGGGAQAYQIEQSIFCTDAGYLQFTPSTTGNRRKFTWSFWVKAGAYDNPPSMYAGGPGYLSHTISMGSDAGAYINDLIWQGGGEIWSVWNPDALIRDSSAWYHICYQFDSTQSITANRRKWYRNGVLINQTIRPAGGYSDCPQNYETGTNRSGTPFKVVTGNGCMSQVMNFDGQNYGPENFGEFDDNGVWRPIEVNPSDFTWGTNGFYLTFDSSASNGLGHDHSGNGNHFSIQGTGLSETADTPTNNFAKINKNFRSGTVPTIEPGGLAVSGATTTVQSTLGVSEGKWYYECIMTGGGSQIVGICGPTLSNYSGNLYDQSTAYVYQFQGYKGHNGSLTSYGASYTNNDVIGIAFDADNGSITFYKNGTSQGVAFTGISGTFLPAVSNNGNSATHNVNYGQSSFSYTPPSGYNAWSTANLPDVAIKNPSQHFRTVLGTGSNILSSAQSVFSTGLWWIKDRTQNSQHLLVDSVRGSTKALTTPATGIEQTYSAPSGNSAVAWCWNLVSDRSNGFDIVTYTGTGTARTVSHSLGYAPEYILVRKRDNRGDYFISYHSYLGAQYGTELNRYHSSSNQAFWNNTAPTSSVFTVGTENSTNASGAGYVAYLWRSVPGFSAMGGYKGNSSSNGPFIYLGFRPAYIYIKATSTGGATEAGIIYDSVRAAYNPNDTTLFPQNEWWDAYISSVYSQPIDMLSNGFKIRGTESRYNNSSYEYFYVAYAEHPFGGSNVSPSPAR